jgi:hypothetical protein
MKFDNIDACGLLKGLNTSPFFAAVMDLYKSFFPNLPSTCPIPIGKYSVDNVTIVMNPKYELNMTYEDHMKQSEDQLHVRFNKALSSDFFPNGVYRHIVKLYNEKDPIGVTVSWFFEINHRMNDEVF